MNTELVEAKEYGIEEKTANELTQGLSVPLKERDLLISEFNEVSKLEITEESLKTYRELRLRIVKNRTQGINKWKASAKEYFLRGGQFVDAVYNKEVLVNTQMEDVLMEGEKHFENLEKERLQGVQKKRAEILSQYMDDADERDLTKFEDDEFEAFLSIKKKAFEDKVEAERLEAERIENERIAHEKAIEEQRIENERLKKEAEAKELALQKERADAIKKQQEAEAKAEKERLEAKAKQDAIELKARQELEAIEKAQAIKDAQALAEKNKLEAELKAIKDAEIKAKLEAEAKAEKERLESIEKAKAPDKEKLTDWINSFTIGKNPLSESNPVTNDIISKFEAFKKWSLTQVEKL